MSSALGGQELTYQQQEKEKWQGPRRITQHLRGVGQDGRA
jgi:hypothetical protein